MGLIVTWRQLKTREENPDIAALPHDRALEDALFTFAYHVEVQQTVLGRSFRHLYIPFGFCLNASFTRPKVNLFSKGPKDSQR